MKKILAMLLVLTMILAVVVGCGSDESTTQTTASGEDPTESNDDSSDFEGKLMWLSQGPGDESWEGKTRPILDRFEELTGIPVEGEFYSFGDLFEVIEVKIASGSSDYDVLSVDVPMVAGYADRGYILPMDDYFTEAELDQFIPSAIDAGTWDGKFYAPPMNTSSQLLWYNQALLDQANITVPESDVDNRLTWEQVVEMADQTLAVVDPEGNNAISGIMFQQVSRVYQMNALPNSVGEDSIGSDGWTVDGVVNTQGWKDVLSWYRNLYEDGLSLRGITADQTSDNFFADKIVFMVGGTWTYSQSVANEMESLGYCPVPTFEGYEDSVATPTGSWHFGIPTNANYVEEAAELIKFMSHGEGNTMWLEANSDVPSTVSGVEAMVESEDAADFMKIAASEALNTAVARPVTPAFTEYSTIMDAMWEDVRNGIEVEDAINSAVEQMETAFERYKSEE